MRKHLNSIPVIGLYWVFLLFPALIFAQRTIKGTVTDAITHLPLPSCSVYSLHTGNGVITESDGSYSFTISERTDSIAISMVGYSPIIKAVSKALEQVINFEAQVNNAGLNEVVVTAKSKLTKAQRLIKKVISHKEYNNSYNNATFQSKVYDKIEFDVKNIPSRLQHNRLMKPLQFIFDNMDSTLDKQKFLPIYLSESTADFYYQKSPEKIRFDYTAIKSSGMDNKSILAYIDGLYKKINIYDNLIKLVDVNFISPIASNALALYNYHIQDTMYIDNHRCIQVQFSPAQFGSNTFNGFMWITDSTYAIKSMVMHMDKNANINWVNKFQITQEFVLDSDKYLPERNILLIDLSLPAMKGTGVIVTKTTLFKDVILNNKTIDTALNKPKTDIATTPVPVGDSTYWENNRFEPLSKSEKFVYHLMDTIKKIPAVIAYGKIIDGLQSGYYTVGKIDIGNIYGFFTSDRIEGSRFDLGFKTNPLFAKNFQFKTYAGYATGDKKIRYSLGTLFVLDREEWSTLRLRYINDIAISYDHDDELDQNSIFGSLLRRVKLTQVRLINNQEANIHFNKYFNNGIAINFEAKASSLTPYFNIYYTDGKFSPITDPGNFSYHTNQVAASVRYAYREKYITQHFRRGSFGSNYPIVTLSYTKGFKVNNGLFKSDFDYDKIGLEITQDFTDGRIGQLSYTLSSGLTNGVLPIILLDVQKGNDTYYYNKYAFNNMNRFEFVADKYVSLMLEQNFQSFPFNYFPLIKKLKWRSVATFRGVIGDMSEQNKTANHYYDSTISYHFTVPSKVPYIEVGVGIANIFHLLRIDGVWRVNYQDNPGIPKFGIKGSIEFKF